MQVNGFMIAIRGWSLMVLLRHDSRSSLRWSAVTLPLMKLPYNTTQTMKIVVSFLVMGVLYFIVEQISLY